MRSHALLLSLLFYLIVRRDVFASTHLALEPAQFATLRLSILQDHFQLAREELLLSLLLHQSQPTHLWQSCIAPPGAPVAESALRADCHVQPREASHLFMHFSFDNRSASRIEDVPADLHPRIKSVYMVNDDEPKLLVSDAPTRDFFFKANNQRGAFLLPTKCHLSQAETLLITGRFLGYTFRYTQLCPRGEAAGLRAKLSHAADSGVNALAKTAATGRNAGAEVRKSQLTLLVKPPFESVHVSSVRVESSHAGVGVWLDAESEADFVSRHGERRATVWYDCTAFGPVSAEIRLRVDIRPFEQRVLVWRKACGARRPPDGLVVSTTRWGGDVAAHGRVLREGFAIGGRATLFMAYFDARGEEDLECGKVETTTSKGFVSARVRGAGKVLRRGRQTRWTVVTRCYWVGEAEVRVVTRFRRGYMLEVRMKRECRAGDVGFAWLMGAVSAGMWARVVVAGMCVTVLAGRRRVRKWWRRVGKRWRRECAKRL